MKSPMVGIFFKVDDIWLIDAVEIAAGEAYGEAIQHGEHYAFWEALAPLTPADRRFKHHAYDYSPRGRVVYFPRTQTYRIYHDPCLTGCDLGEIIERFALAKNIWEVVDDNHYRCARCNPGFLEYLD